MHRKMTRQILIFIALKISTNGQEVAGFGSPGQDKGVTKKF
jgi:hypothetical protein